ncbi:MAG: hypothetical protein ACRC2J_04830 [Microcoleaceae cyanobacterium]
MNIPILSNIPLEKLVSISLFFAIAFGFIFKDMLEYQVAYWQQNRQTVKTIRYNKENIIVAYSAMTFFAWIVMGAVLANFGLGQTFGYSLSAITVFPTTLFIWVQLGSMLKLLVTNGSEALVIDQYMPGDNFGKQAVKTNKK